jgi:hypothetical protein
MSIFTPSGGGSKDKGPAYEELERRERLDDEAADAAQQVAYILPARIRKRLGDEAIKLWNSLPESERRRDLKGLGVIPPVARTADYKHVIASSIHNRRVAQNDRPPDILGDFLLDALTRYPKETRNMVQVENVLINRYDVRYSSDQEALVCRDSRGRSHYFMITGLKSRISRLKKKLINSTRT